MAIHEGTSQGKFHLAIARVTHPIRSKDEAIASQWGWVKGRSEEEIFRSIDEALIVDIESVSIIKTNASEHIDTQLALDLLEVTLEVDHFDGLEVGVDENCFHGEYLVKLVRYHYIKGCFERKGKVEGFGPRGVMMLQVAKLD